jgi:hypothetical protein
VPAGLSTLESVCELACSPCSSRVQQVREQDTRDPYTPGHLSTGECPRADSPWQTHGHCARRPYVKGELSARRPRINVRLRYFRSNLFTYRQRGCLDNASCNARSEESGESWPREAHGLDSKADSYCNRRSCRGIILTAAATNIVEADTIREDP